MKKPIVLKKQHLYYAETSKQKILEVLFKYPEKEFSLSELAKLAAVTKTNIGKILDKLNKMNFVYITKLKNIWRIRANQSSALFIKCKIVYNLNFIYQSGLIEFLNDYYNNPKAIILFGSFRKGEDISGSDIDIAIELDEIKEYSIVRLKELALLEKEAERHIQVHLFNRSNVDINLFNNIANGIVLSGFLEVRI